MISRSEDARHKELSIVGDAAPPRMFRAAAASGRQRNFILGSIGRTFGRALRFLRVWNAGWRFAWAGFVKGVRLWRWLPGGFLKGRFVRFGLLRHGDSSWVVTIQFQSVGVLTQTSLFAGPPPSVTCPT
jgi:hypothetical protein